MPTAAEVLEPRARALEVNDKTLTIHLEDGRTLSAPLRWYPRLWHGSLKERNNFEIFGDGTYIHWPDLDEDLTVAGLLAGKRSQESGASLKKWLAGRKKKPSSGRKQTP
jgi:hypothetical protein